MLSAIPFLLLLVQAEARPAAPPDRLLEDIPADAVAVLSLQSFDEIRARAAQNTWLSFFRDPGWRFLGKYLRSSLELDELGAVDPLALIRAVHGPAAAFADDSPQGIQGGVLVEPGDRAAFDEPWGALLDQLESRHEAERDTEQGAELWIVRSPVADEAVVVFDANDLVGAVVSQHAEGARALVRRILTRRHGSEDGQGFAAQPGWLAARGAEDARQVARCYVDVDRMTELLRAHQRQQADAQGVAPDEQEQRMLEALGLTDIDWLYLDADVGAGEQLTLGMRLDLPARSLLADLLGYLGPAPKEMLQLMPAQSTSVALYRFDLAGAFVTVQDFLAEWAPETAQGLERGLTTMADEFRVDVEQDLLGQLTGKFASFEMPVPKTEGIVTPFGTFPALNGMTNGSAALIGLADPAAVQETIEQILELFGQGGRVEWSTVEGHDVESIDAGALKIHWAFLDHQMVVSAFPSALQAVLQRAAGGTQPTAASNEKFTRALETLGGQPSVAVLADTRSMMEGMLYGFSLASMLSGGSGLNLPAPSLAETTFSGTTTFVLSRHGTTLEARFAAR